MGLISIGEARHGEEWRWNSFVPTRFERQWRSKAVNCYDMDWLSTEGLRMRVDLISQGTAKRSNVKLRNSSEVYSFAGQRNGKVMK